MMRLCFSEWKNNWNASFHEVSGILRRLYDIISNYLYKKAETNCSETVTLEEKLIITLNCAPFSVVFLKNKKIHLTLIL